MPDALPELPVTMEIQPAPLDAVHEHPDVVVTDTEPVPPTRLNDALVGETVNAQEGAAACVMDTDCPATVSVPERVAVLVLAATLNITLPLPLPLAPPVTEIHPSFAVAVQPHSFVVETLIDEFVMPDAGTDTVVGVTP